MSFRVSSYKIILCVCPWYWVHGGGGGVAFCVIPTKIVLREIYKQLKYYDGGGGGGGRSQTGGIG